MGCMCDGHLKAGCIPMAIRLTIPINPVPNGELPNVDNDVELCWHFPGGGGIATTSMLRDLCGVFLPPFDLLIQFDQLLPKSCYVNSYQSNSPPPQNALF